MTLFTTLYALFTFIVFTVLFHMCVFLDELKSHVRYIYIYIYIYIYSQTSWFMRPQVCIFPWVVRPAPFYATLHKTVCSNGRIYPVRCRNEIKIWLKKKICLYDSNFFFSKFAPLPRSFTWGGINFNTFNQYLTLLSY